MAEKVLTFGLSPKEITEYVFVNIFLPRHLTPSLHPRNIDIVRLELALIQIIKNSLSSFFSRDLSGIIEAEQSELTKTFEIWESLQNEEFTNEIFVQKNLEKLPEGSILALYVRQQNACLIIKHLNQPSDYYGTVSSFQVSATNEQLMNNEDDLISYYPSACFYIKTPDLLHSKTFADQLSNLIDFSNEESCATATKQGVLVEEARDVASPCLVIDWLIPILTAQSGEVKDCTTVVKKYRDQVIAQPTGKPFRRSGMWISLKATLNILFIERYGKEFGKALYKSVLLECHLTIAGLMENDSSENIFQIIKKLARRCDKLNLLNIDKKWPFIDEIIERSNDFIKEVQEILHNEIEKVSENFRIIPAELNMNKINHKDNKHNFTKLLQLCTEPFDISNSPLRSVSKFKREFEIQNVASFSQIISFNEHEGLDLWLRLYKFECLARECITTDYLEPKELLDYLENYIFKALEFYKDDPLGYSRMTLTVLKIVTDLDKLAVNQYPLLKEYQFGFEVESFSYLLMPKLSDIKYADSIFYYIKSRNRAHLPSIINIEDDETNCDFASTYAESCTEMQELKKTILNLAQIEKDKKFIKVESKREELKELTKKINKIECNYTIEGNVTVHAKKCKRCHLKWCARSLCEEVYEMPLPKDQRLCNIVLFELLIPLSISVLRDALHVVKVNILGLKTSGTQIRGEWAKYPPLSNSARNHQRYIKLGSTTELFVKTHYNTLSIANTPNFADFIKPNGYNLKYCYNSETIKYRSDMSPSTFCTFKLTGHYSVLQWTMNHTENRENRIIASQSACPNTLMKAEYLKFGMLRSGHRLQMMNILDAIESRGLSFKQESVYFLFAQTLWQLGPLDYLENNNDHIVPDSHLDFTDEHFLNRLLRSIDSLLNEINKNWNDHIVLLVIITVTARAATMSSDQEMRYSLYLTLRKCRRTALSWQKSLQQNISRPENRTEEEINSLKEKLLEVACFTILTYNIDKEHHYLMHSIEDLVDWFTSLTKVYEYSILYSPETSSLFRRNLLRNVNLVVSELEEWIDNIVLVESGVPLTEFVKQKSSSLNNKEITKWIKDSRNYSYTGDFRNPNENWDNEITLGKDGLFLIMGKIDGKLNKQITDHQLYKEFFKNTDFDVSFEDTGYNSYITPKILVDQNHFVTYSFRLQYASSVNLIITETKTKNSTAKSYRLIPKKHFLKILPVLLVKKYSHWFNPKSLEIEFRKPCYTDKLYHNSTAYVLNLISGKVKEASTGRFLICIESNTFKEFQYKVAERLDSHEYVHMFTHKKVITIDFPRLNLSFELNKSGDVISRDFKGMKVSKQQKIETLYGLEKGLILTDELFPNENAKQKIIIPHGILEISRPEKAIHQSVNINFGMYKQSRFFLYDIDYRLKVLRAGESITAWLYLAWLHAATSHILEDPFLGITGTAMALNLLQSSHCWSCLKLSDDSIFILSEIAKLSADRAYIPEHLKIMEKVEWPQGISPLSAHEGFIYLATLIFRESQKIKQYESQSNTEFEKKLNSALNILMKRGYYRTYTGNLRLNPEIEAKFWSKPRATQIFYWEMDWTKVNISNCRTIATRSHLPSSKFNLKKSLLERPKLQGTSEEKFEYKTVMEWLYIVPNFYDLWITMYNYCKSRDNDPIEFTFILSLFAYKEKPLGNLLFLQGISLNPKKFTEVSPKYNEYENLEQNRYDSSVIKTILEDYFIKFEDFDKTHIVKGRWEDDKDYLHRITHEYATAKKKQVKNAEKLVYSKWPTEKIVGLELVNFSKDSIMCINEMLYNWYKNWSLAKFINDICITFESISADVEKIRVIPFEKNNFVPVQKELFSPVFNICYKSNDPDHILQRNEASEIFSKGKANIGRLNLSKRPKQVIDCEFPLKEHEQSQDLLYSSYIKDLKSSWDSFIDSKIDELILDSNLIQRYLSKLKSMHITCKEKISQFESLLLLSCTSQNSLVSENNILSHIYPLLTPMIMLSIIQNKESPHFSLDDSTIDIIGAICVLWTLEQRIIRCISYIHSNNILSLSQELDNSPYSNWEPKKHPEWLVLQIEQDITIRRIQVEVANKMIFPPKKTNTVMQLNMGEGKTSVIIPMIASTMANGNQLVRITVLRSLFNMNYNALAHKLGGALNRKIFVFPCRRDEVINIDAAKSIKDAMEECMKNKGVVLALPEYRLSYVLKGLECSMIPSLLPIADVFNETEVWMRKNCRDILDESDEILNAKYQLVYTIGQQAQISGGSLRWKACQAVLTLGKSHFPALLAKYGENCISYKPSSKHPNAYPHFRLIQDSPYLELCHLICLDILAGKSDELQFTPLRNYEKPKVISFIFSESITPDLLNMIEKILNPISEEFELVVILRGLFTYKLFYMVLTKRWRVNYGVNEKSNRLLQAVPFRAKDVPADRAQFAHPDIAILFTQLSYYYSGLSNSQLEDLFNRLEKEFDCKEIYERWIEFLPPGFEVDTSLRTFSGLNFSDTSQKYDHIFPLLRFHPLAINFWLNHFVYPREMKESTGKIGLSAWDLCNKTPHPMTGFSGTNDSKLLLPLTCNYFDIPKLEGTNGSLIYNLLKTENNNYKALSADVTGIELLRVITGLNRNLRILLDVGALMIDLTNEEVIREWLKLRNDMEAGVFFDFNNDLMVIDKNNRVSSFELSPYRHLENCLVYLDDAHTRGTDLKIPKGTIGAVTLGKGVTKDKMMQGCMRMRMLGNGHSIYFIASHEVNREILNSTSSAVKSIDVLKWAINNSKNHTVDCFLYWSLQGISYYKKQALYSQLSKGMDLLKCSNMFIEKDTSDIHKLYLGSRKEEYITKIVVNNSRVVQEFLKNSKIPYDFFLSNYEEIYKRCKKYIFDKKKFSHLLEEEQELELEVEQEEEREIEKPIIAECVRHSLDEDVIEYAESGLFEETSPSFCSIADALMETSIREIVQREAWGKNVYVTKDFVKTVKSLNTGDDFLKAPRWLVLSNPETEPVIVIFSAYEANQLLPYIENGPNELIMYMRSSRKNQIQYYSKYYELIPHQLIQRISVFAGSQYFTSESELEAYLDFIGFSPSPQPLELQRHFENGLILKNGYTPPESRKTVFPSSTCKFVKDPSELISKLCEIRNYGAVSKFAHTLEILFFGRRPSLPKIS